MFIPSMVFSDRPSDLRPVRRAVACESCLMPQPAPAGPSRSCAPEKDRRGTAAAGLSGIPLAPVTLPF